jgi:hypothetical protein
MIALAELQRQFQERILRNDAAVLPHVVSAQGVGAAARVDVYVQAYRLRLTEALASNFPRLYEWLGADDFAAIASSYIASRPSTFRSVRWVGAELAASLDLSHPEQAWIADLAQWEWALASAFDAADAAPLDEAEIARVAPDRWPSLRFAFHPSAQFLQLTTNAPAIYKALSRGELAPAGEVLGAAQSWLIWRRALLTQYRSLDEAERAALEAALSGASFEDVCDALCAIMPPADVPSRAAALLKGWLADGLIVGMRD